MEASAIESEALELSARERARLASRLLESLEGPADPDAAKVWKEEVLRRAKELDEGLVTPVSGEDLEQRIQAIIR